jgi:hypothetical protein
VSKRSRVWRDAIKHDQPPGISRAVEELAGAFGTTPLDEVLGADVMLVPAPKSTPLVSGALWPALRIAEELVRRGLGKEVVPCVRRIIPVKKSAYAAPGERPTAKTHLESLAVDAVLARPSRVAVVDDVVTKGATLLATASAVKELFPDADVRGFAMLRTMGLQPEVEQIRDPCVGTIRLLAWGETDRQP